jgi:P27 family predicted phage terminase small subunit
MPRKSAQAMSVAPVVSVEARRVKPPEGLPDAVQVLWRQLVDSLPPDRFHASDRPLLALYCRALHQSNLAFDKLEKHGAAYDDSISPWQRVADSAVKQVAALATRLRLCPQSRLDRKVAGPMARNDESSERPWDKAESSPPGAPESMRREQNLERHRSHADKIFPYRFQKLTDSHAKRRI